VTHTPGPWFYDEESFVCSDGPDIASVTKAASEWEANARLIAAAPDLLAALQEITKYNTIYASDDSAYSRAFRARAFRAARAAIAKATGGAS
jgi:hypothetical protein